MAAVLEDGLVMCSYILQVPVINSNTFLNLRFRNGGKAIFGVDQFSTVNIHKIKRNQHVIEGLNYLLSVYV